MAFPWACSSSTLRAPDLSPVRQADAPSFNVAFSCQGVKQDYPCIVICDKALETLQCSANMQATREEKLPAKMKDSGEEGAAQKRQAGKSSLSSSLDSLF